MPTLSEVLSLALAHYQAERLEEAASLCSQVVAVKPDHAGAWLLLGSIASQQGRDEFAVECIGRTLQLAPNFANAHLNLGAIYSKQGKFEQAIECQRRALELDPNLPEAHFNLGISLAALGKQYEAIPCYRRAAELNPKYWKAHTNLAVILRTQGKLDEAEAAIHRALEIRPDYDEAHNNLGNILRDQGRLDEAASCYRRAIELDPNAFKSLSNLGTVLMALGRCEEAADCFRRSLEIKPDYADAHWNQSLVMLLRGDLENGWREFEWRWQTEPREDRMFARPAWHGESLDGKTILLHAEQGFGDTLQFIRYASVVKNLGARVIVECQRPLFQLLRRCEGVDHLCAEGDELPAYDCHAAFMSLPFILNTTLHNIPTNVPYLFADPVLIVNWRDRLASLPGFRVGVNWHGRENNLAAQQRDLPLDRLATLAELPGVRLISLQKGGGQRELAAGAGRYSITTLGDDLDTEHGAFMDTAAIMMNLDLVITSDTSIAHLAGALGVPVWVALPFVPDWRWLLNRSDSPWYPTMRLFRQNSPGNWTQVFAEIQDALKK